MNTKNQTKTLKTTSKRNFLFLFSIFLYENNGATIVLNNTPANFETPEKYKDEIETDTGSMSDSSESTSSRDKDISYSIIDSFYSLFDFFGNMFYKNSNYVEETTTCVNNNGQVSCLTTVQTPNELLIIEEKPELLCVTTTETPNQLTTIKENPELEKKTIEEETIIKEKTTNPEMTMK